MLTLEDLQKLQEMAKLLDEALMHVLEFDGHCKSDEGYIELSFNNSFDRDRYEEPLQITTVTVYSYRLGPSRLHHFDSVDAALTAVKSWYIEAMDETGEDRWFN